MIRAVPERFSGRETEGWQSYQGSLSENALLAQTPISCATRSSDQASPCQWGGGAQGGKPEACRSQLCWDCHGKIEDFDIAPQRDGRAPPVLLGCEEATMPPKQGRGCPIPPSGYFPTHVGKLSDREAGAMDQQTPVYLPIARLQKHGRHALISICF